MGLMLLLLLLLFSYAYEGRDLNTHTDARGRTAIPCR